MKKFFAAFKPRLLKLLIFPPIIVGVLILAYAVRNRMEPERVPEREIARVLRVIKLEPMEFVPRAVGYGTSHPAKIWQAISEVKGKIVEIHPDLQPGSFIMKNVLLVRVDDADTNLAISRLHSEIAKAQSSISELKAQKANYEATLDLEQQALKVSESELAREEELLRRNAGSSADVDIKRKAVIAQRKSVQAINSSLNLLPSQIEAANANLAVSQANLAQTKRDLSRLEIKAPFDCRIGPVDLELNQFVNTNEVLFSAQSTGSVEIEAQFSVRHLRTLFDESLRKRDLSEQRIEMNQESVKRYFDVEAIVRYESGGSRSQRTATFERIREQLDAQTRTGGVVVSIKDPFRNNAVDPPPVSGTFCEVELRAKMKPDQTIIPRSSIRDGHVYVLDGDNRLRRRKVEVQSVQSDLAVIANGVSANDILVVSDPTPAVQGMLVSPETDEEIMVQLRTQARGEGTLR